MELVHATGMQAGYTMGMKPDGRELLVVSIKGTFAIPKNGDEPQRAEEQLPLVEADVFTGEPGVSAPLYESDYAPHKPRCDILLNGSAYAPGGKPATRVPVTLQIGSVSKSFYVVGPRVWKKGLLSIKASTPRPFKVMPFSYDTAFGGVDANHKDPKKLRAYMTNPVGVGFHHHLNADFVDGKPLPNTEETNKPVTKPNGKYQPMSLGPIGRAWQPRVPLAGTYDQNWLDNIFPFLPPDFDDGYFQAAPPDQQMPYPQGGERVVLVNLTPEGRTTFRLPAINLLVWFFMKSGEEKQTQAVIDTVLIEPDAGHFMVIWRSSLPLRKNMFEVVQVVIGEKPEDRYQGREADEDVFPLTGDMEQEDVQKDMQEGA